MLKESYIFIGYLSKIIQLKLKILDQLVKI